MQFEVCHRFARIAPSKARPVVDMVKGRSVNEAIQILKFTHKRAAHYLSKLLRTAVADADQNHNMNVDKLSVSGAWVNEGPLVGRHVRWRASSLGRAMPIRKRTSHIHLVISDEG